MRGVVALGQHTASTHSSAQDSVTPFFGVTDVFVARDGHPWFSIIFVLFIAHFDLYMT